MDRLNVRILRELSQGDTVWPARPGLSPSYRVIARAIGAAPGTVRNRLQEMSRSGFLRGYGVYANPAIIGLHGGSYAIEIPAPQSKPQVMERILSIEGIIFLENFHGSLLGIGLVYRDAADLERILTDVDAAAHAARGMFTEVRHPPCPPGLPRSEGSLLRHLVLADYESHAALARELRISPRTLRRRIEHLTRDGAVLSYPRLDYRALRGAVTAELLVALEAPSGDPGLVRKLMRRLEAWMTFAGIWESYAIFRLILPNVATATQLAGEVQRIKGIRFARVEFVDDLVDQTGLMKPGPEPPRIPERQLTRMAAAGSV